MHYSSYHGGDFEGPSLRELMAKGNVIFEDIKQHLLSLNLTKVSSEDISEVCYTHAKMMGLLNGIFSICHTLDNNYSDEIVQKLLNYNETLMLFWKKMQFSFTPKIYLLLDHMADEVVKLQGSGDLDESYIERWHQI